MLNVKRHIVPALGSMTLQNLTSPRLNALYADLLESGRRDGKGRLSPRTARYVHTIIRKALKDAVRWNPAATLPDYAQAPRHVPHEREQATWTPAELRTFLDGVRDDRLYAAFMLAGTTGVRRGEVLGLRWRDVDLDAGRAAVTQTLLSLRYKLMFSTPKTAKGRRSVALDRVTISSLRVHRKRQLEERLALGPGYHDDDLVFVREDGQPFHPELFSELFVQHTRRLGLPGIRLHDLRHTHATLALAAGVHPKVVSERLGHATVSITLDTYSHGVPSLQEEAAEQLAPVVCGAS